MKIGDIIKFGRYYKTVGDKKEDIEWLVLDKEREDYLLISKEALDARRFNPYNSIVGTNWGKSEIRKWLNEEFFDEIFCEEEKKKIVKKKIHTPENITKCQKQDYSLRELSRIIILNEIKHKQLLLESFDNVKEDRYDDFKWYLEKGFRLRASGNEDESLYDLIEKMEQNDLTEEEFKRVEEYTEAGCKPETVDQGEDVQDNIFLLSKNEFEKYYKSADGLRCYPTLYAKTKEKQAKGEASSPDDCCDWWLRTMGSEDLSVVFANSKRIDTFEGNCSFMFFIRPAIWITDNIGGNNDICSVMSIEDDNKEIVGQK